ncbi:hypothetical protein V6N12_062781 [Hibiscus sabdariffa]|uniref:Uncharacterized protein n=1 Tax=Hibiscus sabdariffa TaxID=183260 RepID=A0ABR2F9W8_9ROSI
MAIAKTVEIQLCFRTDWITVAPNIASKSSYLVLFLSQLTDHPLFVFDFCKISIPSTVIVTDHGQDGKKGAITVHRARRPLRPPSSPLPPVASSAPFQ